MCSPARQKHLQRRIGEERLILELKVGPIGDFFLFRDQVVAPLILQDAGGIFPDPAEGYGLALGIGVFAVHHKPDFGVFPVARLINIG